MLLFIDSEILIGNAFVASLETSGKRFISWDKLIDFSDEICKIFRNRNNEFNLLFTKEYTEKFLQKYRSWFKETIVDGETGLLLIDSIGIIELRNEFRVLLNIDTIRVFNLAEDKVFGQK